MDRKVEEITKEIEQLSLEQLREFRAWYRKFDSEVWYRQIEEDMRRGKLDAWADIASVEQKAGESKVIENIISSD